MAGEQIRIEQGAIQEPVRAVGILPAGPRLRSAGGTPASTLVPGLHAKPPTMELFQNLVAADVCSRHFPQMRRLYVGGYWVLKVPPWDSPDAVFYSFARTPLSSPASCAGMTSQGNVSGSTCARRERFRPRRGVPGVGYSLTGGLALAGRGEVSTVKPQSPSACSLPLFTPTSRSRTAVT